MLKTNLALIEVIEVELPDEVALTTIEVRQVSVGIRERKAYLDQVKHVGIEFQDLVVIERPQLVHEGLIRVCHLSGLSTPFASGERAAIEGYHHHCHH